jgi:hypothetical protein
MQTVKVQTTYKPGGEAAHEFFLLRHKALHARNQAAHQPAPFQRLSCLAILHEAHLPVVTC